MQYENVQGRQDFVFIKIFWLILRTDIKNKNVVLKLI